jgi:hypothetical protein
MIPFLAISLQPLAFFTLLDPAAQLASRRGHLEAVAPRPPPNCAQLCLIKFESGKNAPKQGIFSRPNHDINP